MTHHPHVHVIVPGGGLSAGWHPVDRLPPGFFLPVKVLSRLFRRLFLEGLVRLHKAGKLRFFGDLVGDWPTPTSFAAHLSPLRKAEWVCVDVPGFARSF